MARLHYHNSVILQTEVARQAVQQINGRRTHFPSGTHTQCSPADLAEPGVGLGVGGHGLHGLDRVVDLVLKMRSRHSSQFILFPFAFWCENI